MYRENSRAITIFLNRNITENQRVERKWSYIKGTIKIREGSKSEWKKKKEKHIFETDGEL